MPANCLNTDHELFSLLKEGDKEAFTCLYNKYSPRLLLNLIRLVKIQSVAEEILQEAFLSIWEKRERLDIQDSFYGYLIRVAENKAVDFFRKLKRDKILANYIIAVSSGSYSHVEEEAIAGEMLDSYSKAIDTLPDQRKQVFNLCKIESKSYKEVGTLLGISTSTINDHIVKAMRLLKKRIVYP